MILFVLILWLMKSGESVPATTQGPSNDGFKIPPLTTSDIKFPPQIVAPDFKTFVTINNTNVLPPTVTSPSKCSCDCKDMNNTLTASVQDMLDGISVTAKKALTDYSKTLLDNIPPSVKQFLINPAAVEANKIAATAAVGLGLNTPFGTFKDTIEQRYEQGRGFYDVDHGAAGVGNYYQDFLKKTGSGNQLSAGKYNFAYSQSVTM